jgi:hypothetical protein
LLKREGVVPFYVGRRKPYSMPFLTLLANPGHPDRHAILVWPASTAYFSGGCGGNWLGGPAGAVYRSVPGNHAGTIQPHGS